MAKKKAARVQQSTDWAEEVWSSGWAEEPDYSERASKYFSPPGGGFDSPSLELPPASSRERKSRPR